MKYTFLVVEGPHDVAAIGKMLNHFNFKLVHKKKDVDPFWLKIIPKEFPSNDNLLMRMPVPTFYQKSNQTVAVYAANGYENLSKATRLSIQNIDAEKLHSVGVFCDADNQDPVERCRILCESLNSIEGFSKINGPGQVVGDKMKFGIYIFPDNESQGMLEDVLIDSASKIYPDLLQHASTYISQVDPTLKQNWGISDESKALFGCLANIFQPGKANQVTIQRDEWISTNTLDLYKVEKLWIFISELLEIEDEPIENRNVVEESPIPYFA